MKTTHIGLKFQFVARYCLVCLVFIMAFIYNEVIIHLRIIQIIHLILFNIVSLSYLRPTCEPFTPPSLRAQGLKYYYPLKLCGTNLQRFHDTKSVNCSRFSVLFHSVTNQCGTRRYAIRKAVRMDFAQNRCISYIQIARLLRCHGVCVREVRTRNSVCPD